MAIGNIFNEAWYLKNYPDVAAAVAAGIINAHEHYEQYGRFEGRSPSPVFDPVHYLTQHPDVAAAVEAGLTTAYDHFLNFGATEGRSSVAYFDPVFYLQSNPDIAEAVAQGLVSATEHFLLYGQSEPRAISPFFDLGAYMRANPDVADAAQAGFMNPLEHLLVHGVSEGRDLGNGVSLAQFQNDPVFQQAIASGGNPLDALARIEEVAPFIPTFQPPAGWTPPADTPIPTDFVPVEGQKLIIPPSVTVPDDIDLPEDVFEPADPTPQPEPEPDPQPDPTPGPVRSFKATLDSEGVISFKSTNLSGKVSVTLTESGDNYIATFTRGTKDSAVTISKDDLPNVRLDWADIGIANFKPGAGTVLIRKPSEGDGTKGALAATIQGGVDASAVGGTVLVGAGTYTEDILINRDDVKIVLSSSSTLDGGFVVSPGVEGFHLSGGGKIINGLSTDVVPHSAAKGIYLRGSANVEVDGIILEFITNGKGQPRGIEAEVGDSVIQVTGAQFVGGWASGIYLNSGNDLQVEDSAFKGATVGIGTDGPARLMAKNNSFEGLVEGVGLTKDKVIEEVQVVNNQFQYVDTKIANGGDDTGLEELQGTFVVVVASGQEVQTAIEAFYTFDRGTPDVDEIGQIILGTGYFDGPIKINGNLKLIGQGDTSVVQGSIRINDPSDANKVVSNIWLEDLKVDPEGSGVIPIIALSNHDAIYNTKNLFITNVIAVADAQHGIGLFDVNGVTIRDVDIVLEGEPGGKPFYAIEALGIKNGVLQGISAEGGFANGEFGALNISWTEGYEANGNIKLINVAGADNQTVEYWPLG